MKNRIFLLTIVSVFFLTAAARSQDERYQIERDVWIQLFSASDRFDAEGFLAVYSTDLVRIAVDQKEALGLEEYAAQIRAGFKRAKERGIVRKSEARFLDRSVKGRYAFETGYFRSVVTMPNGEKRTRYSRFEFVLRKDGDRWKILVDRDTSAGETVTEQMYMAATPMQSLTGQAPK